MQKSVPMTMNMPGLYFLGIKKSALKKIQPFKFLFDWRDKKIYKEVLQSLSAKFSITNVSEKEGLLDYRLNNKALKLAFRKFPVSDVNVLDQVFEQNAYLPIIERMQQVFNAHEPLKIIDAGANVGYAAVYFQTFFPAASIVAVEPESGNVAQLQKNLSLNNYKLKGLVKGGLWHRKANLEVVRDFRDNREAAFTVQETNRPGLEGYSFSDILQQQGWTGADLVKIDIEGSERFLFDTEEKADAILQHTKFLAIEIHDEFNIRSTIYQHLERNGFVYFEYNDLTLAIHPKYSRS